MESNSSFVIRNSNLIHSQVFKIILDYFNSKTILSMRLINKWVCERHVPYFIKTLNSARITNFDYTNYHSFIAKCCNVNISKIELVFNSEEAYDNCITILKVVSISIISKITTLSLNFSYKKEMTNK